MSAAARAASNRSEWRSGQHGRLPGSQRKSSRVRPRGSWDRRSRHQKEEDDVKEKAKSNVMTMSKTIILLGLNKFLQKKVSDVCLF